MPARAESQLQTARGTSQVVRGSASGHLRRLWSAEGLALAMGVLQGLVVARQLGPDGYGVYALAVTFVAFVFLLLDPRAAEAVVRYVAEFRAAGDMPRVRAAVRAGFLLDACWGAAGLLVAVAVARPAAGLLSIDGYAEMIAVVAIGASVAAPASTSRAVLSVFERFKTISHVQVSVSVLRALSVIAVALGGFGLWGVIWTLTVVSLLEGVLFVSIAVRAARHELGPAVLRAPLAPLRGRVRDIAHFLVLSDLSTLASTAIKQVDTLVLGLLTGPREAGYYRLAKSLTAPSGNVGVPVQTLLYPRLAAAEAEGDFRRADDLVRRTVRRVCLPLAFAALLCIPLVGPVIRLVAGEEFEGSTGPAIALVAGVALSFATLHVRPVFLVRDQLRALLGLTVATSTASLAAFFPAAAGFGADGVAWARTLMVGLGTLLMLYFLHRTRQRRHAHSVDTTIDAMIEEPT